MRERIIKELQMLEATHDVRIILAVESGSRGWGFPSADSDYDVRFVYLHRPEWYLSVDERKDCIELPCDGLLDINGWELRKALRLFRKSNPPLLEWLRSPVVYAEIGSLADRFRDLTPHFFSPVHAMHHYFHTARNKALEMDGKTQIRLKRYFYMLRPLLACLWIEANDCCPPMDFESLLGAARLEPAVLAEIQALLKRKAAATESDGEPPNGLLMKFIWDTMDQLEPLLSTAGQPQGGDVEILNRLFRQSLAEYWKGGE